MTKTRAKPLMRPSYLILVRELLKLVRILRLKLLRWDKERASKVADRWSMVTFSLATSRRR